APAVRRRNHARPPRQHLHSAFPRSTAGPILAHRESRAMRRFGSHLIGVDHGSMMMFSDFEDGGAMWTGQGPRELRRQVGFASPYRSVPVVHVSMSMFDVDHRHHLRADISADAVAAEGFVLVFRTWGDTRVARIRADWLAIGEL